MGMSGVQAHASFVGELYELYSGIVQLHGSFMDFFQQLKEGDFLQCSLDTVMMVRHTFPIRSIITIVLRTLWLLFRKPSPQWNYRIRNAQGTPVWLTPL
jgi:hypothetical protein